MRRLAFVLAFAVAAVGCNESTLIRPGVSAVFFQAPPTEVDILLVVDDSCSMEDEQTKLGEGFDRFVEFFDVADVDYHIGVITTDTDAYVRSGKLVGSGSDRIIDRDTDNADDVFRANVNVGTSGWPYEKGFDAAALALSDDLLEGHNEGFLRDDALLSIIFVSDEEVISQYGINSYVNFWRGLKDEFDRTAFNASALIGIDPDTLEPANCGPNPNQPNAAASYRYHDVAVQTGGVVGSICDNDFADVVNEMGLAASRLLSEFVLERRPKPETLEMRLFIPGDPAAEGEGLLVPWAGTDDGEYPWDYFEDEANEVYRIEFTDLTSLPPVDSQIVLHYELF